MGVRFWPLLGLWAGITEIIPIVGPWLGGIPAVAIAATQSWDKAIMVAIFVVLLQFSENSILVPRVMRGAVGLVAADGFRGDPGGHAIFGGAGSIAGDTHSRGDPGDRVRILQGSARDSTGRSRRSRRVGDGSRLDRPALTHPSRPNGCTETAAGRPHRLRR